MKFDKSKIDEELRAKGEVIHFVLPHYTKTKMKIVDKISSLIFKGKKPTDDDIDYKQIYIDRKDKSKLRVCLYSNKNSKSKYQLAVLWIHGGGYAMSVPEQDLIFFKQFVKKYNAVVIAPDYTKSLEKPFPAALEDVKLAFEFIKTQAEDLKVVADKIFVGGDSAGGGLAIALSLFSRDANDQSIACCFPIYPMISLRHTETSKNNNMPVWNTKSNDCAWKLYLNGVDKQGLDFKYAVPAEETDYSNLPPMISYVGTEDPFYAETVEFIENLKNFQIEHRFKIFEGCYHGFDVACPKAAKSKQAKEFLMESFEFAYNKFFKGKKIMNELKTKAVIFDFDGTLTIGRANNVWKMLYLTLGYDLGEGSSYKSSFLKFKSREIDYASWVEINKQDFVRAGLNREIFDSVLKEIKLIQGLEDTLKTLTEKGVKLFVLSGNIRYAIKKVLGDLAGYFTEISANDVIFDEQGNLENLVPTKYDFEGKADFIVKVRDEIGAEPNEIVFVGNGSNDVWAYKSGAKTICVNPKDADENNNEKWTKVLPVVKNLTEILDYID